MRKVQVDQDRVRVSVNGQGVAGVALCRPDKMNALDPAMFAGLAVAIARVRADPRVRVVVLHGEGRAFCAGLDEASLQGTRPSACSTAPARSTPRGCWWRRLSSSSG